MLLAIYALVRAPEVGWNTTRTIVELGGVVILLLLFLANERRHPNPLVPLSIFRIKGLAAADVTQIIAMAGFYSMFFFVTLYMQNVLHFSPTRAGVSYIPVTVGVAISAGVCSKLFVRTGTRPIMVAGALLAAGGVYWLSRIPVHGSYLTDLLPGLMIMSIGLGAVFVGVQTAANAGVPPDKAGLAAALINASFQLGAALGLAIFSAVATSRTNHLLAATLRPTRGSHLRVPPRPVGLQRLPGRCRSDRAAGNQYSGRTDPERRARIRIRDEPSAHRRSWLRQEPMNRLSRNAT